MEFDRATEDDDAASEQDTEAMLNGIDQDLQAQRIELPHGGLRDPRTARVVENTSGPAAVADRKRPSRTWRK